MPQDSMFAFIHTEQIFIPGDSLRGATNREGGRQALTNPYNDLCALKGIPMEGRTFLEPSEE